MSSSASRLLVPGLYRRGQRIAAASRWASLALGSLALLRLWDSPLIERQPCVLLAIGYAVYTLASDHWLRRHPRSHWVKRAQAAADAITVGLGADFSGGLASPVWLLLYPHVVAFSLRGGPAFAAAVGTLDAGIVALLALATPGQTYGFLHALALLWCAFVGAVTTAYLQSIRSELRGQAERLSVLNEIANAVNSRLTIEDILAVAAAEARRLVPLDGLTLALVEPDGPGVEVVRVGGEAGRHRASFERDELVWALRRPVSWCSGGGNPAPPHAGELLGETTAQALATLPLLAQDRVIGSLNVGRSKALPFSAWDLAVLEPVARQMAIALDNARLLEALRRRSREFELLFEIGRGVVARLDLAELLPQVVRSVNTIMGTHYCLLLLREGDRLRIGAQEGIEPEVIQAFQDLKVGDSLSGQVALDGEPLMIVDMLEDPRLRFGEQVQRFGYRSYLCVPLTRGEEVLGTLEVVTKEVRRFRPDERDLMAGFATAAAVAIDNARLYEAARAHVARLADANRRLEELDRQRKEYLRNVSHEFRTPLTVIRGYGEYLRDAGTIEEESLRDVMRTIVESCDRVIDLVDTLLEVSRLEHGVDPQSLQLLPLDLQELASSSLESLQDAARRKRITLDLRFPEQPLRLLGDSGLLHQLVRRLVDNAIKYSPEGSRVVVQGHEEGGELALEVEDFGIGIGPEHLPRIFEKFYMADGGIARRVAGTGVGLYLVREIVKLHEGTISVRSLPGKGSLFSVRLPRRPQGALRQKALV